MNPRFAAIAQIQARAPMKPIDKSKRPSEIFAENVFSRGKRKQFLSREAFQELEACIEQRRTLDRNIAEPVANAIKAWAMDMGATHYTHWFQPLTGRTAEKHDSFLELSDGEAIDKFSGEELSQQEPDASAFPSGGLRTTFEARGYTAWDCSSPVFIFETTYGITLCIPTIFVSYTGQALDYKLPLLRSISRLDKAAVAVCNYFDKKVKRVNPTLGIEQEYFLIDRNFYELRPDLILTGRTVLGASSARGQQLEDHYFGSIHERVFAFMNELELDCHRLGIPLKTRHNEVAPSQFECSPRYESINVAIDHGLMMVDLIDRTARKHHLAALLHEKPFDGINGSGKHNNWSLETDTGVNLLSPGADPQQNLMFLIFFVSVIRGIHEHADLLRASIASLGNDLRLGANEAPPKIISVYIGSLLSKVLEDIENPPRRKKNENISELMHLGISEIPELLLDNTDSNRISPIAFTGNKFEFRAVGASMNSSGAMTIFNTIVARQLENFQRRVDRKINRGRNQESAILDVIRDYIIAGKKVLFEGDGYSELWKQQAKERGLSDPGLTPFALDAYLNDKSKALFSATEVYSTPEIQARYEVSMNEYLNRVRIEVSIIRELAMTKVIPASIKYQKDLLKNISLMKQAGLEQYIISVEGIAIEISECIKNVINSCEEMEKAGRKAERSPGLREIAASYAERVIPTFQEVRKNIDRLEGMIDDDYWTLPKYREMLFVK